MPFQTLHISRRKRAAQNKPYALPQNSTLSFVRSAAKTEYVGVVESLEGSGTVVIITVAVIVIISLIFAMARSKLFAAKVEADARREREDAHQRERELLEETKRLEEQNKRIQDQLMLTQLNKKQAAIVEANSVDLDNQVPAVFQLNWRDLLFESRLGSGSFGDCYRGRCVLVHMLRSLEHPADKRAQMESLLYPLS